MIVVVVVVWAKTIGAAFGWVIQLVNTSLTLVRWIVALLALFTSLSWVVVWVQAGGGAKNFPMDMTIPAIVITAGVVVLSVAATVVKIPASALACRGALRETLRTPFCESLWAQFCGLWRASRVVQWVLADEAAPDWVQPRLARFATLAWVIMWVQAGSAKSSRVVQRVLAGEAFLGWVHTRLARFAPLFWVVL
jgi:hypothetical protein